MPLPHKSRVHVATLEELSQASLLWAPKALAKLNPSSRQFWLVFSTIAAAGSFALWFFFWTGHGSVSVLKQRLAGEVHLSTGDYPARTVGDLNQISWDNGLRVLALLDDINSQVERIATFRQAQTTPVKLAQAEDKLDEQVADLHELLQDRDQIEKAARLLQAKALYTPVYKENLRETMDKLAILAVDKPAVEGEDQLVQQSPAQADSPEEDEAEGTSGATQ